MEIWRANVELDNKQSFQFVNKNVSFLEELDKMLDGKPYNKEIENFFDVEMIDDGDDADFIKLWNCTETLLCTENARDKLKQYVDGFVEFIPVRYKNKYLYMVKILKFIDALNYKKTEFEYLKSGLAIGVLKYSFIENMVACVPIFKIFLNGNVYSIDIFVSTELKKTIEECKLEGLVFTEVWDSEGTTE